MANCRLCGQVEFEFTYYSRYCYTCDSIILYQRTYYYIQHSLNQHEAWIKSKHLGILTSIAEHQKKVNAVVEKDPQPVLTHQKKIIMPKYDDSPMWDAEFEKLNLEMKMRAEMKAQHLVTPPGWYGGTGSGSYMSGGGSMGKYAYPSPYVKGKPATNAHKVVESECSICASTFSTSYNEVLGIQRSYLCNYCEENYGREGKLTVDAALSSTQEMDDLLQEAEDYHNGIIRPKKAKPEPAPTLLDMAEEASAWDDKPIEVKNPFQKMMDERAAERESRNSQSQSNSNSQSQSPKKDRDWWKILGIIIITAVVTAFFTSLLI